MEISKGSVPEREEFRQLRNGEGGSRVLLWPLEALFRFALRRLCPQPHSRKYRAFFWLCLLRDRS